jgi:PDZ domain-containing protein
VALAQKYVLPFEVTVDSRNIGGPSAGLMFAVGILDQLNPEDLSRGFTIAGTGTIDDEGQVGVVGGVEQKMLAAQKIGAKYFFVPNGEKEQALASAPSGMTVIGVGTLHDAVGQLMQIPGRSPGGEPEKSRPKGIVKC